MRARDVRPVLSILPRYLLLAAALLLVLGAGGPALGAAALGLDGAGQAGQQGGTQGAAQAGLAGGGVAQAEALQARAAQAEAVQSGTVQTGTVQAGAVQAGAAQAGVAQAAAGQAGAAQVGANGAGGAAAARRPLGAVVRAWLDDLLAPARGVRPGNPFLQGLLAGLLGAGVLGVLAGRGFFSALMDAPGVLGTLLQLLLLSAALSWLWRRMMQGLVPAGSGFYTRFLHPGRAGAATVLRGGETGTATRSVLFLDERDARGFEELLHCMQAAWCAHDLAALRSMTTETMADAYAEQMALQQASGVHDKVSGLTLQKQEVREAWTEAGIDRAMVLLRYYMCDVTVDVWGRVVAGQAEEPVQIAELWQFVRTPRGRWRVAAIEQPS